MGVNLKQFPDGSLGMEGKDFGEAATAYVDCRYDPNTLDQTNFVAPRQMRVVSIVGRVEVAGTDAGAVTAAVKKVASGTDIAAGTVLHSGTMNLKGTVDTNQTLTLSTTSADLDIPSGTAIGVDITGVMTAARGVITVGLRYA